MVIKVYFQSSELPLKPVKSSRAVCYEGSTAIAKRVVKNVWVESDMLCLLQNVMIALGLATYLAT